MGQSQSLDVVMVVICIMLTSFHKVDFLSNIQHH